MKSVRTLLALLCLTLAGYTVAEAPIAVAMPKKARGLIVAAALSFEGAPYVYGGIDPWGFDCSGLVYRVFLQTLGVALPRTALEQYDFREPIDAAKLQPGDLLFFNTTGPISHVGIYEGEGVFIHAASEGSKRGVIESSLSDGYWAGAFAGAGRIIPPAEYLGLVLSASLGPSLGTEDFLRGVRGSLGVAYRILGLEAGLELRPEYDASLGDFRLPLVLAVGIDRRLKVFAGPAVTFGSPDLGGNRGYEPQGGLLATAGVEYTFLRFRIGDLEAGIAGELVYNRYVPEAPADIASDSAARLRAGLGLSLRTGM
jgi:probable lipoprotein NlpC